MTATIEFDVQKPCATEDENQIADFDSLNISGFAVGSLVPPTLASSAVGSLVPLRETATSLVSLRSTATETATETSDRDINPPYYLLDFLGRAQIEIENQADEIPVKAPAAQNGETATETATGTSETKQN